MIFLTGDTHGALEIGKLSLDNFPAGAALSRKDMVVILGDFGLLWSDPPAEEERKWLARLEEFPWTTLFLDGNHENFHLLGALPTEERFGSPVGVVSPHVLHLRRGYVYSLEGKRYFVFGGARSVDRKQRIPEISWWPGELPSAEELRRALDSLQAENWSVDYIFTHTAPTHILRALDLYKFLEGDPVSAFLDEIYREVSYSKWFCGHLHRNLGFQKDRIFVLRENIMDADSERILSVERDGLPMRDRMRMLLRNRALEGD